MNYPAIAGYKKKVSAKCVLLAFGRKAHTSAATTEVIHRDLCVGGKKQKKARENL